MMEVTMQAKTEVEAVIADAISSGVPVSAQIRLPDVKTLMELAFMRGMAAERESYAARARGTTETEFGSGGVDAPW